MGSWPSASSLGIPNPLFVWIAVSLGVGLPLAHRLRGATSTRSATRRARVPVGHPDPVGAGRRLRRSRGSARCHRHAARGLLAQGLPGHGRRLPDVGGRRGRDRRHQHHGRPRALRRHRARHHPDRAPELCCRSCRCRMPAGRSSTAGSSSACCWSTAATTRSPPERGTTMSEFIEVHDARFHRLLHGSARIDQLWTGGRWCEGPAYVPAGRYLVWSDIPNDRLLRWDETERRRRRSSSSPAATRTATPSTARGASSPASTAAAASAASSRTAAARCSPTASRARG